MQRVLVCAGDVSLRITLDAKWQARPLMQAVAKPFAKSYNERVPEAEAVSVAGLERAEVDGREVDPAALVSEVVPQSARRIDLVFGAPPPREIKVAVAADGGFVLKITLDSRWMGRTFDEAVVVPYLSVYNKRVDSVRNALAPSQLFEVHVNGSKLDGPVTDLRATPAGVALRHRHVSHVDLYFSAAAVGAASASSRVSHNLRFVCTMTPDDYRASTELVWHHQGFNAGDAAAMASRLLGAAPLKKLKYVYLYNNDLRDAGVGAIARALTREHTPALKQLLLNANRIGSDGAIALADGCNRSPELDLIALHSNHIGDDGVRALAHAMRRRTLTTQKMTLHTNPEISAAGAAAIREVLAECELDAPVAGRGPTPFIPLNHTPQRWADEKNYPDQKS